MAYLKKTSTMLLGEQEDFERESYLEGFIFSNPGVLSSYDGDIPGDSETSLLPVYIIGRQSMVELSEKNKGITDLTCLIWNPDSEKYEIWIYELKTSADSPDAVDQLIKYLDTINSSEKKHAKDTIIENAIEWVGEDFKDFIDQKEIRGALCAQDFSDAVLNKITEENKNRKKDGKGKPIAAVKINMFSAGNDNFVVVDSIVGDADVPGGKQRRSYEISNYPDEELKDKLISLITNQKDNMKKKIKTFLNMLVSKPEGYVTMKDLRNEWTNEGLLKKQGKEYGAFSRLITQGEKGEPLRHIINFELRGYDLKENYRLKEKYTGVIKEVLEELEKSK